MKMSEAKLIFFFSIGSDKACGQNMDRGLLKFP